LWCRPEGQNQGKDGIMDKKKPIGYTKEQTKSMKALIERTQEKAGDYVGSGTVTAVPKKKKKMPEKMPEKKMRGGGLARKGVGMALRGGGMASSGGTRTSAGSGVGGVGGRGPSGPSGTRTSGSLRGGVSGRAGRFASGGIVGAPARSYKDMRAGAGSGVGRIQKMKIAGRGR